MRTTIDGAGRIEIPKALRSALDELSSVGITGGAAYDGLIAATARQAEATLLTLDRRAVAVYQSLGTAHRVLA